MPYAHRFEPIPWQVGPWKDRTRTLLMHGGAGSGKSIFCAEKMHALMLRYPHATGLVDWSKESYFHRVEVLQKLGQAVQFASGGMVLTEMLSASSETPPPPLEPPA